jgi:predicted permease
MRPVLAECLVLTAAGAILGLALAWLAVRTIGELAVAQLPQLAGLAIELRIVVFALSLSAIVALLCGALPAWNTATADPQDALRGGRGGSAGSAQQRALGGLVVTEVALSLILLIAASLVLRGFSKVVGRDPGFDPHGLLVMVVGVAPARYSDTTSIPRFLEPALDAIERLPGVQSAGAISHIPYRDWGSNSNIRYEGQPNIDPEHFPLAEDRTASPDFFKTSGQRLIAGRYLSWDDDNRPGVPLVVMVNESLVRRDFPSQDPIGKRFYAGMSDSVMVTIAGVVSDIPNAGPIDPALPEVYWSYAQSWSRSDTWFNIAVRVKQGDPVALEKSVSAAIHSVDAEAAVSEMAPMTEVMAKSVGTPRFYLTLIGTFALVAVALAVAGLYGVMSYVVAQRTREIGIRTALGSTSSRTLGLVARGGMRLLGIGVLAGVIGGALATRVLASLLYGVSPADAPTWILATLSLVTAGAVALVIPAARAARVDPIIAIRAEQ